MYSIHNKRKYVVVERFIRTLNNKNYNCNTSTSKVYIDKFDDIVNKCNNTYHSRIKSNPVDVRSNTYIDFGVKSNEKDPKFKVGDHVKILKHDNIFVNIFVIEKFKNTVRWTYVISDLNDEEIFEMFHEKEFKEQITGKNSKMDIVKTK